MSKATKVEAETAEYEHAADTSAQVNHGEPSDLEVRKYTSPAPVYDDDSDFDTSSYKKIEQADVLQPHWRLLQSLSGEVKRSEPEFIEGALEGQWFDTIRKELFDEIVVVLVDWRTAYLEWKLPRSSGGFMGDHGTAEEAASILARCHRDAETGGLLTGQGSELVETAIRYCLVVGGKRAGETVYEMNMCRPAILSFYKTSQKAGKGWLSDVSTLERKRPDGTVGKVAPWAQTYLIGAKPTSNQKGSWFIPKIDRYVQRKELPNASLVGETAIEQQKMLSRQFARIILKTDDERPNFAGGTAIATR